MASLKSGKDPAEPFHPGRVFPITGARLAHLYQELVLLFAQTVNNLSMGDSCRNYKAVVDRITPEDTLITFNWDVILDRVLWESGRWDPGEGYGISFGYILDGTWQPSESREMKSELKLLKLHGSTNWLEPYVAFDLRDGRRKWIFRPGTASVPVCYVNCDTDLPSYHDMYTPGGPFCYGFPPNHPELPESGYLYPMIVAPSLIKYYEDLPLSHLWAEATQRLRRSGHIVVVGYSFPPTDKMAWDLIREAATVPGRRLNITLVGPAPEPVAERLKERLVGAVELRIRHETFEDFAKAFGKGKPIF
ncbi:MAG: hypothetical protein ACE5JC_10090 [Candidatus Zixiibacteriota bacterium]